MAIILALNKKGKLTASELAGILEVNIRTIYRDIQTMSEIGIPIISDIGSKGGYSLISDYFIPPVTFNKDEVFALLLAKYIIDVVDIPGYKQHINSAFLKIENLVNNSFRNKSIEVVNKFNFGIKKYDFPAENFNVFKVIKQGLEETIKIKMEHPSKRNMEITFWTLHPYGLYFEDGIWILIAYCEVHKDVFLFEINKINNISITNEKFEMPKDFNVKEYFSL